MDWYHSILPNNVFRNDNRKINVCDKCGHNLNINAKDHCNCLYRRAKECTYEFNFLKKDSCQKINFFNLNGIETWAKIVKIYDGDTCHVVLLMNKQPYKFRVRLANIDTAEKNSDDPLEVAWAERAIQRFQSLIAHNPIVWIKCHNFDKYGRLLADLFPMNLRNDNGGGIQTQSINETLLQDSLAYKYDGSKRKLFADWAPKEALFIFN